MENRLDLIKGISETRKALATVKAVREVSEAFNVSDTSYIDTIEKKAKRENR